MTNLQVDLVTDGMIDNLKRQLFGELKTSIGGYFYKRKSHYIGKQKAEGILSSLFQKFSSAARYQRRYFIIDITALTLSYGLDPDSASQSPSGVEQFRNIVSVKSNVVSMPIVGSQPPRFEEVSIFDTRALLDRGPDDDFH